jgi:hypothetical protein
LVIFCIFYNNNQNAFEERAARVSYELPASSYSRSGLPMEILQNHQNLYIMPGRAGGSRGSAPSMPYLNEARPAAISPEGLSGRRGAPTGAEVRGVTPVIFLMFLIFLIPKTFCRDIPVDKPIQTIQPEKKSSVFRLPGDRSQRRLCVNKLAAISCTATAVTPVHSPSRARSSRQY